MVKETLSKLPKHMKRKPEYRGKTIAEIVAMEIPETLSRTTVKNKLIKMGTLFDYAINHGFYEGPNPVTGMLPKDSRRPHEARAPYNQEELNKLFRSSFHIPSSSS